MGDDEFLNPFTSVFWEYTVPAYFTPDPAMPSVLSTEFLEEKKDDILKPIVQTTNYLLIGGAILALYLLSR